MPARAVSVEPDSLVEEHRLRLDSRPVEGAQIARQANQVEVGELR